MRGINFLFLFAAAVMIFLTPALIIWPELERYLKYIWMLGTGIALILYIFITLKERPK